MPVELLSLFDRGELEKYLTKEELAVLDGESAADAIADIAKGSAPAGAPPGAAPPAADTTTEGGR
jgi:hypothetical protein